MDVENFSFEDDEATLPPKFAKEGLTFDDVLLVPAESSVLPNAVSTATRLTRTIVLEVPVVAAAMDTVTEWEMAVALAREGGIGILHRNLPIDAQVGEVDRVKRSEAGMISDPVTLQPEALVSDAWTHPYPREQAAYPAPWTRERKFWPSVSRLNSALGDRKLVCARP